ncbi:hypothetical protein ALI144C_31235 [Actinosynnema sp. ALI-1.44]|nr:hypothetical protein ALI144C_31235 [Actinosynnema sp. ALI-1.44]
MQVLCQGVADVVRAAPLRPSRVSVRFGCASLDVEWPATASVDAAVPAPDAESKPELDTVTAPLVGTFYRASEPGATPFVAPGDLVEPGQQVAIIEAMKLLNPILAEQHGEVVDVLVADAQPVEYGQPLLRLRPPRTERTG